MSEYTPLSEIESETSRVSSSFDLPTWVKGSIGVNVPRLVAMMDVSGIHSLNILSDYRVHSDRQPMIQSIDSHGTATAVSDRSIAISPFFKSQSHSGKDRAVIRNSVWTSVELILLLHELEKRIQQNQKKLSVVESWVPHIDHALRSTVLKEGIQHLLLGHTPEQLTVATIINAEKIVSASALGVVSLNENATPEVVASMIAFNSVSWIIPFFFYMFEGIDRCGRNKDGAGYRVSLIPGYELDRALQLFLMAKTKSLVKALSIHVNELGEEARMDDSKPR